MSIDTIIPAVVGASISGGIGLSIYLVNRLRAEGRYEDATDKNTADAEAMWKRIDELRSELDKAKVDLALLQAAVKNLPDHDHLRERMESLEDKIDKKLDRLRDDLRDIFESSMQKWSCPMVGRP